MSLISLAGPESVRGNGSSHKTAGSCLEACRVGGVSTRKLRSGR